MHSVGRGLSEKRHGGDGAGVVNNIGGVVANPFREDVQCVGEVALFMKQSQTDVGLQDRDSRIDFASELPFREGGVGLRAREVPGA